MLMIIYTIHTVISQSDNSDTIDQQLNIDQIYNKHTTQTAPHLVSLPGHRAADHGSEKKTFLYLQLNWSVFSYENFAFFGDLTVQKPIEALKMFSMQTLSKTAPKKFKLKLLKYEKIRSSPGVLQRPTSKDSLSVVHCDVGSTHRNSPDVSCLS